MPAQPGSKDSRIMAGVDGLPSSLRALRWAIRQADLTGASVDAVIAWHYPDLAADYGMAVTGTGTAYDFTEMAEKTVTEAINSTLNPASDVAVHGRIIAGHPVQALLDAGAGASLLVVGSRGHGGFTPRKLLRGNRPPRNRGDETQKTRHRK